MIDWVKANKLSSLLFLIIIVYLILRITAVSALRNVTFNESFDMAHPSQISSDSEQSRSATGLVPPVDDPAPQPDVVNRMVVQESSLSLQVNDVEQAKNDIVNYAVNLGGYMVNSQISHPDEQASATVIVRVPNEKLNETISHYKENAIKVVSETTYGRDVTDQHIDIEERIATYEVTKKKYEAILENATEVEDITRLTREIVQVQQDIDSLRGQQQYLQQISDTSKITIFLSTDDLSLPYAPEDTFRPNVIFKLAVRSLIGFARTIAEFLIWFAVYSIVWVPILALLFLTNKYLRRTNEKKN